jgi:hypothetical protein
MRALASVAAYLFLTALAPARCAVVEVLNVQPSAQRVRITTLRDAKPVGNVPVAVLSADEQPRFSFSTNNKGTAVLPKLSPGRYHIAATAPGGFRADLILEVTVQPGRKTSSFSMDLVLKPPPPPTMEEKIAAAENTAPAESLKVFTGFVVDPHRSCACRNSDRVLSKRIARQTCSRRNQIRRVWPLLGAFACWNLHRRLSQEWICCAVLRFRNSG